jgi:hypothetical protein
MINNINKIFRCYLFLQKGYDKLFTFDNFIYLFILNSRWAAYPNEGCKTLTIYWKNCGNLESYSVAKHKGLSSIFIKIYIQDTALSLNFQHAIYLLWYYEYNLLFSVQYISNLIQTHFFVFPRKWFRSYMNNE